MTNSIKFTDDDGDVLAAEPGSFRNDLYLTVRPGDTVRLVDTQIEALTTFLQEHNARQPLAAIARYNS